MTPRNYLEDYPTGLPRVTLGPPLVHECGQNVAPLHVPGATLTMDHDGDITVHDGSPAGYSLVWASSAFAAGDSIDLYQSLCGDDSDWMTSPVLAEPEPFPLTRLAMAPPESYEGQELVVFAEIVPGSVQDVTPSLGGALPTFPSWPTPFRTLDIGGALGRALLPGEVLSATQTLCEAPSATFVSEPALDCALVPPAQIALPNDGETFVILVGARVPGATTRVWSDDSMSEIGDSGGDRITLGRPLSSGETIRVIRDLTGCTAGEHYVYVVN